MTKAEQRKLTKQIKDHLGSSYRKIDDILITELCDWLTIQAKAKEELQSSIEEQGSELNWQKLTNISMATKAIVAILVKLNITPEKRMKDSGIKKDTKKFNLQEFLNNN